MSNEICPTCSCGTDEYEIAELERQLAEERARVVELEDDSIIQFGKYEAMKQRAEQAEQRIAESQSQEPFDWEMLGAYVQLHDTYPKLYAVPVVPPDVEEAVKTFARELCTIGDTMEIMKAIRARSGK